MHTLLLASVAALTLLGTITPAYAGEEAETLVEAVTEGKASINFRYHLENVEWFILCQNISIIFHTQLRK